MDQGTAYRFRRDVVRGAFLFAAIVRLSRGDDGARRACATESDGTAVDDDHARGRRARASFRRDHTIARSRLSAPALAARQAGAGGVSDRLSRLSRASEERVCQRSNSPFVALASAVQRSPGPPADRHRRTGRGETWPVAGEFPYRQAVDAQTSRFVEGRVAALV